MNKDKKQFSYKTLYAQNTQQLELVDSLIKIEIEIEMLLGLKNKIFEKF